MVKAYRCMPVGFYWKKEQRNIFLQNITMRNIYAMIVGLLCCMTAWGQTPEGTVILKSPNDYQILSISPNGKWACGVYNDYSFTNYAFRWNLESDQVEMLDAANSSEAWSISNDGTVAGSFTDTDYRENHSAVQLPGVYANGKWTRLELPIENAGGGYAYSITPDGHYITGVVNQGNSLYIGVIWKDGKIHRQLNTEGIYMPYTISPDGQSAAGWMYRNNRTATLWPAEGEAIALSDFESPWSSGRKFSPDGKKLLYWGGWNDENESVAQLECIYDIETGTKTKLPTIVDNASFELFDIDNNYTIVGEESGRGYINIGGKGQYIEDYLTSLGIDISELGILKQDGVDHYEIIRGECLSADGNVIGILYYNDEKDSQGNFAVSLQSMIIKLNQDFTQACPVGIEAVQLTGIKKAKISWAAPLGAKEIKGYNVYRNGVKVNEEAIEETVYVDNLDAYGEYSYEVTAIYDEGESLRSDAVSVNIKENDIQAPTSLFARQLGYNNALVRWEAPESNLINMTYFDKNTANFEGFGVNIDNFGFEAAIKFDKVEVTAYSGNKIKEVFFYPMTEQQNWTINLYSVDADGKLQKFYTQAITQQLEYGKKNVVELDTPQPLPNSDLYIAVEMYVPYATQDVLATDFGKTKMGYTDLVRGNGEPDFYSLSAAIQSTGSMYNITWMIGAVLGSEDANENIDKVDHYLVKADGTEVATTNGTNCIINNLGDGNHDICINAVYADNRQSVDANTSVAITANDNLLKPINDVVVENKGEKTINATWQKPVDNDFTCITYSGETPSNKGVIGPAENNYGLMCGAIYTPTMLKGYNGYAVKSFRFYPVSDATYTIMLYKNNEQVCEVEVDDYVLNQWNTVALDQELFIDENSSYMLVIDCYDVTPDSYVLGVDNQSPVTNYSDLYSEDGSYWSSINAAAIYANWMMGMNIEAPESYDLPVSGYDVRIDGDKQNETKLTATTYTHDFKEADSQQHSINVDVYYTAATSVKGDATYFYLNATGIDKNVIAELTIRKGENFIVIDNASVTSIEAFAANGEQKAAANGNTLDISNLNAGVYLIKAKVDGKTIVRKIQIK